MEAAEYAVERAEASLDDAIGRRARITLGRCAGAAVLGLPVAWFGAGMQWNGVAFGGLAVGVALFALIDTIRTASRARTSKPAREERDDRPGG